MIKTYLNYAVLYLLVAVGTFHPLKTKRFSSQTTKSPGHQINQLLTIAQSQVGVREATGNNDGLQVEKYLAYTGNIKGEPWCAAFVSWVFGQAGYKQPCTAWSPALFPKAKQVVTAKPAMVFGIYFKDKGRIAHAGLVEKQKDQWIYTIEGNTNIAGSREGDGVYRKLRHAKTIAAYANWLPPEKGGRP
ncbi:C40 family peptidase [Pedobacter helvus]|uniref:Peptidoglycan-binding protein n=1 Tax=Pedobacter helvus TaxID=2563444 RepID=A0ABW9JQC7_9SPHI|nr:peptidoglycan-binding protein [Pedobacter ureilyticus]